MLKQKALISFLSNIIINFIGLFSSVIVARYMGPEALGVLSASQAYVNIFGILGGLGFGLAHFKRVSEGMDLGKCVGTFFTIRFFLSLFMFVVIISSFYAIGHYSGTYIIDKKYILFFWIIAIGFTLGNISQSIQLTFSAKLEVSKNSIIGISQKFINSSIKIIIAFLGFSVIYLAWGNLLGVIIITFIAIWLFKGYPNTGFDKATYKSYLVFAGPLTVLQFLDKGAIYLDKVFLSYFVSEVEVGYFVVAQSLTNVLLLTSGIFVNLLIPVYSKMYANGEIEKMQLFSQRIFRLISLLITPILIYIFFFSKNIVYFLYGANYQESIIILQMLSVQILFYYYLQPFMHLVTGSDMPKLVALNGGIAALLSVVLDIVLIPKSIGGFPLFGLGAKGAAIALVVSVIVRFLLFRIVVFRKYSIRYNKYIIKHLSIAILINLFILMVSSYMPEINQAVFIIIGSVVSALLYILILVFIKEANKDDYLFMMDLLKLKKLKESVKSDFSNNNK